MLLDNPLYKYITLLDVQIENNFQALYLSFLFLLCKLLFFTTSFNGNIKYNLNEMQSNCLKYLLN